MWVAYRVNLDVIVSVTNCDWDYNIQVMNKQTQNNRQRNYSLKNFIEKKNPFAEH